MQNKTGWGRVLIAGCGYIGGPPWRIVILLTGHSVTGLKRDVHPDNNGMHYVKADLTRFSGSGRHGHKF